MKSDRVALSINCLSLSQEQAVMVHASSKGFQNYYMVVTFECMVDQDRKEFACSFNHKDWISDISQSSYPKASFPLQFILPAVATSKKTVAFPTPPKTPNAMLTRRKNFASTTPGVLNCA